MVALNYRTIEPQRNYNQSGKYELQTPVEQSVEDYLRSSRIPRARELYSQRYAVAKAPRGEYRKQESAIPRHSLPVIMPVAKKV